MRKTGVSTRTQKIDVPAHKRSFGMVFQDFALWPHMTVYENVAFGLKASKLKADLRQKVTEALAMVRLEGMEDRYPHAVRWTTAAGCICQSSSHSSGTGTVR